MKLNTESAILSVSENVEERLLPLVFLKPAIHFTDKLDILECEKERAIKIYGNSQMVCGGWNSVWTEIGAKTVEFKISLQRDPERG
ncbi:hypothetical protein AVEN_197787-1 [Araneus ventricosus]|uniref:Uncharacterized protein n=1 Tax=Araneus ventricosus TaxID=182803 RepID=A0A4Y2HMW1_ARAVE|nr:hypothetical protein AVEN_197787-1 [Araneus ventricosus]